MGRRGLALSQLGGHRVAGPSLWLAIFVFGATLARDSPTQANPVPDREWQRILAQPGRYLRDPNPETRRDLVWTLGDGSLDVYLETPDTLALILRNLETFVPLVVSAQTPPFVPDENCRRDSEPSRPATGPR